MHVVLLIIQLLQAPGLLSPYGFLGSQARAAVWGQERWEKTAGLGARPSPLRKCAGSLLRLIFSVLEPFCCHRTGGVQRCCCNLSHPPRQVPQEVKLGRLRVRRGTCGGRWEELGEVALPRG